ncbi:6-phosphofructokinase [Chloroflexota bacterium]
MKVKKRVGILTGGGDCPGLNAAIRATAKTADKIGYEVIGIRDGWEGLMEDRSELLDSIKTAGIIDKGGTILGATRTSPFRVENGTQRVFDGFKALRLEALVVLGGEGTLAVTSQLFKMGLPVVGIPKTIDNDVEETDFSIGFQTAVQIATDALDRLRSTAASHHRVMLLEVMGRRAGWIATFAAIASGAEAVIIPEVPLTEKRIESLCHMLKGRNSRGKNFSIIVVAEGTQMEGEIISRPNPYITANEDRDKLGGVGQLIGALLEKRTGLETRVSSLDYIQRGGTPVAYDRSLATFFGVKAARLVKQGRYGRMVALKRGRITSTLLEKVEGRVKLVNPVVLKTAEIFFGEE